MAYRGERKSSKGGESHLNMESLYEFAKLLATRMTEIGQYSVSEHRVMEWLPPGTESLHLNEVRFEAYSLLQKHDFGAGERSYRFPIALFRSSSRRGGARFE